MDVEQELRPAEVLLVEDDDDDAYLTVRALEEAKLSINLTRVSNGLECIAVLRQEGDPPTPFPDLVLLDLNMPRMSGQEVLGEMSGDAQLSKVPVTVMTTSVDQRELMNQYKLNTLRFISKPIDFNHFREVLGTIEEFFLSVVVREEAGGEP